MQKFETTYELFSADDEIKRMIINSIVDMYNKADVNGYGFDKQLELLDILCGCLQALDKDLNEFLKNCQSIFN